MNEVNDARCYLGDTWPNFSPPSSAAWLIAAKRPVLADGVRIGMTHFAVMMFFAILIANFNVKTLLRAWASDGAASDPAPAR